MNEEAGQEAPKPNRRQMQAAQTRRDIILVATRLFTERGYARTSVADIANEAGVSIPTIYASVGAKSQLITAMLDEVDSIAGIPELAVQIQRADDPREVIALTVRLTRQVNERCHDIISGLRSGAHVEPELAEAYKGGIGRHRAGAKASARRLEKLEALRPGLDVETAGTALAVMTSIDIYSQLRSEHGWSFDRCEEWMNDSLKTLLLKHSRA